MPQTTQQISQNIITQVQLLDPAASFEVGTLERKIVDSVAETIAAAQVDFTVLDNQFNLNALSGGALDAYLGNFGFARQQAVAAVGTVTFARTSPATSDIIIPEGIQINAHVTNSTFPDLIFATTSAATLANGTTSVDVSVQCTTPGTVGNIPSNSITGFAGLQSIAGITTVTNANAMTGGVDLEDDASLKVRFQNTVFRNMAGTYDQFMALAVAASTVTKANVIGPMSRYQEYIQVPASNDSAQHTISIADNNHVYTVTTSAGYDGAGTTWPHKRTSAVSRIPYAKFIYDNQFYLTDGNLGTAATFLKPFVDFVFNRVPIDPTPGTNQAINTTAATNNQPNFTFLNISGVDSGANPLVVANAVLLSEFAYISSSSRNDYYKGIFNAVDIFVNGSNNLAANSQEVMPGSTNTVQNSDTTKWPYQNYFARKLTGGTPAVGNKLIPLFWQPVTDLPQSIKITDGTTTYFFYKANYKNSGNGKYYNQFDGTNYSVEANYFLVEEVSGANSSPGYYGTVRARNGIEFSSTVNGYKIDGTQGTKPATDASFVGQQFQVTGYTYDKNISDLQAIMEKNKQITTDVLVHRAYYRYFKIYINIMYTPAATQSVVNASVATAISSFFNNQFYGAAIQLSDILNVVHNVFGVDNVQFSADGSNPPTTHRVEEVFADGTSFGSPSYLDADFFIKDNQLAASPANNPVVIVPRAAGTW